MLPSLTTRAKRLAALLSASALTLFLAGCFLIQNQTVAQVDTIGDVVITTDFCEVDPGSIGSTTPCAGGLSQNAPYDGQFVVAYVISSDLTAPASVPWTGTLGTLSLARDDNFATQMQALYPAPSGSRYVSYASGRLAAATAGVRYDMTATARFGVSEDAASTVNIATFTGQRFVRDAGPSTAALALDRPFDCNEKLPENTSQSSSWCATSAAPTQTASTTGEPATVQAVEINTLKLTAPAPVGTVESGSEVTLNFGRSSHAVGGASTSVPTALTSTITGATIIAPTSLDLASSDATVPVKVRVPYSTASGTYQVRLAAAGGLRSATASFTVKQRTLQESVDALLVLLKDPAKVKTIRRANTFDLPVFAPQAGTLRVRLTAKVKRGGKRVTQVLAAGKRSVPAGDTVLRLVPTKIGRRVLRSGKDYRGTMSITLTTSAGVQKAKPAAVKFGK